MSISEVNLQHLLRELDSLQRKLQALLAPGDGMRQPWLDRLQEGLQSYTGAATDRAAAEKVLDWAVTQQVDLNIGDLRQLQRLLTRQPVGFRTVESTLRLPSGAIVRQSNPEDIQRALEDILGWCQHYAFRTHPVLLAAEWYTGLLRTGPFDSGTEALAYLLMNYHLMRKGYPPIVIGETDRPAFLASVEAVLSGKDEAAAAVPIARQLVYALEWNLDLLRNNSRQQSGNWEQILGDLEQQFHKPAFRTEALLLERLQDSIWPVLQALEALSARIDPMFGQVQRQASIYLTGDLITIDPFAAGAWFEQITDFSALARWREMDVVLRWSEFRYRSGLGNDLSLNLQFRFEASHYALYGPDYMLLVAKDYHLPLSRPEREAILESLGRYIAERIRTAD
jgi:hypothetical protein